MGASHLPKWQNGFDPVHLFPQAPQLLMSFCSYTQIPPQHVGAMWVAQSALVAQAAGAPPVPAVVLLLVLPVVAVVTVPLVVVVAPPVLCVVVVAPPLPPVVAVFPVPVVVAVVPPVPVVPAPVPLLAWAPVPPVLVEPPVPESTVDPHPSPSTTIAEKRVFFMAPRQHVRSGCALRRAQGRPRHARQPPGTKQANARSRRQPSRLAPGASLPPGGWLGAGTGGTGSCVSVRRALISVSRRVALLPGSTAIGAW
jgi:hypothetical protein